MFTLALLAAITAAAAAPGEDPGKPRLLNVQDLVTAEDYPLVSLRKEEQGTVMVKVRVDVSGLVTSCTVTKSSGHPALDEQTCALFRARAQFEPARDRRGRGTESDYIQKVTWKLASTPPVVMPRGEWIVRYTYGLGETGKVFTCEIETVGASSEGHQCPSKSEPGRTEAGQPNSHARLAGYQINETYFYPVEPASAPVIPEIEKAIKVAELVTQVTIAPDGTIAKCDTISSSGVPPDRDECKLLSNVRFAPAAAHYDTVGTLIQREYARRSDRR